MTVPHTATAADAPKAGAVKCGRLEPAGMALLRAGPETLTPWLVVPPPAVRAETPTAAAMTATMMAVGMAKRSQPLVPPRGPVASAPGPPSLAGNRD
jgi:hypothetical protein